MSARGELGAVRFRALILSDRACRDVSADDIAALLRSHGADARDTAEFRAAERDAAYDARDGEGGE